MDSPPTRLGERLDLIYTNIGQERYSLTIRPPLRTPDGKESDHLTIFTTFMIARRDDFRMLESWSRPITKKGMKLFEGWIQQKSWCQLSGIEDVNTMAESFVRKIDDKMNECFPWKKYRTKSTNDPRITPEILRKLKKRMKTYLKEHRSPKWKDEKRETDRLIKESKRSYYNEFLEKSKTSNKPSLYYNMVNRLKEVGEPVRFDVCSLFPDISEKEVAEKVADFFTQISERFTPLQDRHIPTTDLNDERIELAEQKVLERLRICKKPNGLLLSLIHISEPTRPY